MAELTQAQHDARALGIGGSDAAAACGISRWKTPVQLWLEKTGQVPEEDLGDKEFVRWGSLLEDVISDEWARRQGRKVRRSNITKIDRELPFMRANIDRDVVGLREGFEAKNSSVWMADEWGEDGSDEVPAFYLIQGAHYMRIMDYDAWNFGVLLGGNELRSYRIERNLEVEKNLIEIETYFWECVTTLKAPEAIELDDLVRLNPRSEGYIAATPEIVTQVSTLAELKARMKADEETEKTLKLAIGKFMGPAGDLILAGDITKPIFTYRTRRNPFFDKKKLKADHPEIVDEYTTEGTTRVMLVK